MDEQLEKIVHDYNFTIPDRKLDELDQAGVTWRSGKPDYHKADLLYFKGKSKNHPVGSLEMIVENLVKKWEMEFTHLVNLKDVTTIEIDQFKAQVNGTEEVSAETAINIGSYNWLLQTVSKELYDPDNFSFESSHKTFRSAFVDGFAWEVLKVFSGPPKVAFMWRHWGAFTGEYKGRKGNGEVIEMYGFTIANVTDDLKITKLEVYFDPEGFLQALEGKLPPSELQKGKFMLGPCCPIYGK